MAGFRARTGWPVARATTRAAFWLRSKGLLLLLERFGIDSRLAASERILKAFVMDHRSKLDWAKKHLDRLEGDIHSFVQSQPHEMTVKYDAERAKYVAILHVRKAEPPDWSLMVGDIVHNVRSALDSLVYALTVKSLGRLPTGDEVRQIQFVIVDQPADWNGERGRRLKHLAPTVQAEVEKLQPYHRPDPKYKHQLSVLRDLSNIDKHRHILVVVQGATDAGITVTSPSIEGGAVIGGWRGLCVDRTEIATFDFRDESGNVLPTHLHPKMHVRGHLALDVLFGPGRPAGGGSVIGFLRDMHNHVGTKVFPVLEPFL